MKHSSKIFSSVFCVAKSARVFRVKHEVCDLAGLFGWLQWSEPAHGRQYQVIWYRSVGRSDFHWRSSQLHVERNWRLRRTASRGFNVDASQEKIPELLLQRRQGIRSAKTFTEKCYRRRLQRWIVGRNGRVGGWKNNASERIIVSVATGCEGNKKKKSGVSNCLNNWDSEDFQLWKTTNRKN